MRIQHGLGLFVLAKMHFDVPQTPMTNCFTAWPRGWIGRRQELSLPQVGPHAAVGI